MNRLLAFPIQTETNIVEYLKEKLKDIKLYNSNNELVELNYFKGYIPKKKVDGDETEFPYILLRYIKDSQIMENGAYQGTIEWNMLIGIYNENVDGYHEGIQVADRIKRLFMQKPIVNAKFAIVQNSFDSYNLSDEYTEMNGDYHLFGLKFQTYQVTYQPNDLEE
ncbi:MAG: hypothetical protein ACRC51_04085 [Cetobacterium sp.]